MWRVSGRCWLSGVSKLLPMVWAGLLFPTMTRGLLIAERAADDVRRREMLARQEAAAIAEDELRGSRIWKGLSADQIPQGMSAVEVMVQAAAADSPPRRRSPVLEMLDGESMTYHSMESMQDAS
jgi:hypothetical protein